MAVRKKTTRTVVPHPEAAEPQVDSSPAVKKDFPIVGIGASAGGLAAFEAFFSGMPKDASPGMAFVLVQHLAPDHKSILTDLIRRYTSMQVFEVEDGMEVKANCAYIIPPNYDMAFLNGCLQLLQPSAPRGQRMPIDFFFRSLAQDQHERAICIVLSGTGSDGTQGVRAIKGEGGMVMVQTPASTEYDGMPRNALATGLVDYELPPAEMAAELMAYVSQAFRKPLKAAERVEIKSENSLKKIYVLLRSQTGHDFSQYKSSTIHRRIERRLAVHQIKSLEQYARFLQQNSAELDALFHDLLIGVTSFFRDAEAFKELEEKVIPALFTGKTEISSIRIWSAGCSTGEEAYSIAILMRENMEKQKHNYKVQIFATDIDSQAIAAARTGLFPASITSDISPERLARFFTTEPDGNFYRIHKNIRDMVVFSEQDLVKDPPFSKLSLISCRNLLIYMGSDLQKKLIPLFHYALNPGGFLFLGTSETVGEFTDIFTPLNRKLKLYQRKQELPYRQGGHAERFHPSLNISDRFAQNKPGKPVTNQKLPLRELTEGALIQQFAPSAALVKGDGEILYIHGRTGMFLEPPAGEAGVNNILKMARPGLQSELATLLHKAATSGERVYQSGLKVKTNGDYTAVDLTVAPVAPESSTTVEPPLFLVILKETPPQGSAPVPSEGRPPSNVNTSAESAGHPASDFSLAVLKQELQAKEEYLKTANEELETSNEELKSSNEEMQSVNEELQSTNEELETSKEELQSVNEELATVNVELQNKVTELARANNDMNNLLAGTGIATIFVDHQLRILRFTPTANAIINLIQSDLGRPVGHILTNLMGYNRLIEDTREVLMTLIPKELEVQTNDNRQYTLRIQPYRTLENVIEGAVLTFVDVTEIKRGKAAGRVQHG